MIVNKPLPGAWFWFLVWNAAAVWFWIVRPWLAQRDKRREWLAQAAQYERDAEITAELKATVLQNNADKAATHATELGLVCRALDAQERWLRDEAAHLRELAAIRVWNAWRR